MITEALIALFILVAAGSYIVWGLRVKNGIGYRSAIVVLIVTVFLGLVILGFPLAFNSYRSIYPSSGIGWIVYAAILQSVQNAFRTFVLDGSWDELLVLGNESVRISLLATIVGLSLSIIAPILTFSAILSLFKELTSKVRVQAMAASKRPLFLFSELNKNTVFLAEDIRKKYPKSNIVYTDVYPEDDETNYELKERAGKLHAVMLRTDITELNLKRHGALTEFFILGHDEEENVMQTRKLFKKHHNNKNTSIYVLSVQKGNEMLLDSLTSSLDKSLRNESFDQMDYKTMKDYIHNGGILRLRRVDPEKQIAWREIPKMQCIRDAFRGETKAGNQTLSMLVFADTHLSFSIIKTLLWFCQSNKFRLELNIVYADDRAGQESILSGDTSGAVNVKSLLEYECPDILSTNKKITEGDAFYDIGFIGSSEFESGSFQNQLISAANGTDEPSPLIRRFLKTNAVIVDRGSDGATLETAAMLRTSFERIDLKPEIYAIYSDAEETLRGINPQSNIFTYKDECYDIFFIGNRSDTYNYDNIKNTVEEDLGFYQHIKWIDVSYGNDQAKDKENALKRELLNYERHEYFRNSSIVKAMYLRNVLADPDKELSDSEVESKEKEVSGYDFDDNTRFEWRLRLRPEYECKNEPKQPRDRWKCTCDNCILRRKLEHNRWNAYMRTEGYISSPHKEVSDKRPLAKIHGNIVPFDMLGQSDREKDG